MILSLIVFFEFQEPPILIFDFQLALATDGRETYCIMQYGNLPWAASKGFFAQSGFTHQVRV